MSSTVVETTPIEAATPVKPAAPAKAKAAAAKPKAAVAKAQPTPKAAPAAAPKVPQKTKPAKKQAAAAAPVPAPKPLKKAEPKKVEPKKAEAKKSDSKPPKIKMIRDSFTFPEADHSQLAALKKRVVELGRDVKKGELVRAGIAMLTAMDDQALQAAVSKVDRLKTGRPKN